jgi:hypothetical protein
MTLEERQNLMNLFAEFLTEYDRPIAKGSSVSNLLKSFARRLEATKSVLTLDDFYYECNCCATKNVTEVYDKLLSFYYEKLITTMDFYTCAHDDLCLFHPEALQAIRTASGIVLVNFCDVPINPEKAQLVTSMLTNHKFDDICIVAPAYFRHNQNHCIIYTADQNKYVLFNGTEYLIKGGI